MISFDEECKAMYALGFGLVVRRDNATSTAWGIVVSDLVPVVESQFAPERYTIYSVAEGRTIWTYKEGRI